MKYVFFFQAEDGIRDGHVTGVQTCALPISKSSFNGKYVPNASNESKYSTGCSKVTFNVKSSSASTLNSSGSLRSEERRVGKECRSGACADEGNKNEYSRKCGLNVDNSRRYT